MQLWEVSLTRGWFIGIDIGLSAVRLSVAVILVAVNHSKTLTVDSQQNSQYETSISNSLERYPLRFILQHKSNLDAFPLWLCACVWVFLCVWVFSCVLVCWFAKREGKAEQYESTQKPKELLLRKRRYIIRIDRFDMVFIFQCNIQMWYLLWTEYNINCGCLYLLCQYAQSLVIFWRLKLEHSMVIVISLLSKNTHPKMPKQQQYEWNKSKGATMKQQQKYDLLCRWTMKQQH